MEKFFHNKAVGFKFYVNRQPFKIVKKTIRYVYAKEVTQEKPHDVTGKRQFIFDFDGRLPMFPYPICSINATCRSDYFQRQISLPLLYTFAYRIPKYCIKGTISVLGNMYSRKRKDDAKSEALKAIKDKHAVSVVKIEGYSTTSFEEGTPVAHEWTTYTPVNAPANKKRDALLHEQFIEN